MKDDSQTRYFIFKDKLNMSAISNKTDFSDLASIFQPVARFLASIQLNSFHSSFL